MVLFEVPGWSMSSAPVQSNSKQTSKKRKRPSSHNNEGLLKSAEINMEKLVKKLKGEMGVNEIAERKLKKKKEKLESNNKESHSGDRQRSSTRSSVSSTSTAKASKKLNSRKAVVLPADSQQKARKKDGRKKIVPTYPEISKSAKIDEESTVGLTKLQKGMKNSLDGARFRWINELLYKTDSAEAHKMMKEDPNVYADYHSGFRSQVHSWPTNPVSHYVFKLQDYPARTVVADLGCGDASLAKALIPKGVNVLSYDLVSDGRYVTEADICKHVPLPGSEGHGDELTVGEGHIVNVVVCALSLMGTNWVECIRQAWRILKGGGELLIAEVASRLSNVDEFQALVCQIGFKLISKDEENSHFTLFEFKKVGRKPRGEKEWNKLVSRGDVLKACEYKRR